MRLFSSVSHPHTYRGPKAAALAAILVISVTACVPAAPTDAETTQVPTSISVTGTADDAPTLAYDTPFVYGEARSEILWVGSGDTVREGHWALLKFYAEDPETGDVLRNDYLEVPVAVKMTADTMGSELYNLLVDQPTGTRAMQVTQDGSQSSIVVVDLLPAHATGEPRPQSSEYPSVEYDESGQPTITVSKDLKKPAQVVVQQLRGGSSEQVEPESQVVLQYVGVSWKTNKVVDSTWTSKKGPVSVQLGAEQIITGLEQALVGAPIGSQLLVIVPPEFGFADTDSKYAKSTLVYVVDVLASSATKQ